MNSQKIINLLTICRRAGKAVTGFDAVCGEAKAGNAKCALIASDISARTEKEINFICEKYGVPIIKTDITKEEYSIYMGKQTGVIAINDKGFADKFIQLAVSM